jgi:hypothetical protein
MSGASRSLLLIGLALTTGLTGSCSSGTKLSVVRGKVFIDGQPAEGATIVFHRKDGGPNTPTPTGTVQADGSFTLRTYPLGDGAAPGEYTVVITWFSANEREHIDPHNKLPARYASVTESPLRAVVGEGPTVLDAFDIRTK